MFLTKSRWPGQSTIVKLYFSVLNSWWAMSMVTPRSRSVGEVVHDVGELEATLALLLGFFLVLFDDVLGYAPRLVEEAPDHRALPVVDVADDGQVLVSLVAHGLISRERRALWELFATSH
jgi:hypothetical protein